MNGHGYGCMDVYTLYIFHSPMGTQAGQDDPTYGISITMAWDMAWSMGMESAIGTFTKVYTTTSIHLRPGLARKIRWAFNHWRVC